MPALLHQTRTHLKQWRRGDEKNYQQQKKEPTASVCVTTQFHLGPSSATITDSIDGTPARRIPPPKKCRRSGFRIECQLSVHSACYTSCYKKRKSIHSISSPIKCIRAGGGLREISICTRALFLIPLNNSGYEIELYEFKSCNAPPSFLRAPIQCIFYQRQWSLPLLVDVFCV